MSGSPPRGKRGVLLFSGGIDSTLSALILREVGYEVMALSVNYRGRPAGEIQAAEVLRQKLLFSEVCDVRLDTGDILRKRPDSPGALEGWVPFRNLMFWSIAAHKAVMLNAAFVAGGHDFEDGTAFNDASSEFFKRLEAIFTHTGNTTRGIQILLPLRKPDVDALRLAKKHNSILELTWSCWIDGGRPCLKCYACKSRTKFLSAAQLSGG